MLPVPKIAIKGNASKLHYMLFKNVLENEQQRQLQAAVTP